MTRLAALFAVLASASGTVLACGMEDGASVAFRRGALQLAYPEALHVGTAVWQAQLADQLPRDPVATRSDLSPEERGALRLSRADELLHRLSDRVGAAPSDEGQPGVSIVLIGPVHWSRLEIHDGAAQAQVHVDGPADDDVVLVTELPVVEAIVEGRLDFARAIDRGLVRLYGPPARTAAAREWLAAATGG